MNIALFTETYLPYINGVVTHVKALKDGLEKKGHKVLVVTAKSKILHHYIEDNVLYCPAKEFKRLYSYGLASPLSLKRLKLLRNFKPDIIHIHNEFGIGFSGARIAKRLGVPLVYTLHTMYDEYLYYVVPKRLVPAFRRVSHKYLRYLTKKANAITGPSLKVQDYIDVCGIKRKVNVIPNPVELDLFDPERIDKQKSAEIRKTFNIKNDDILISFCGRLGREKSVDKLLDDWAATVKKQDKFKLMIIGEGPCLEELKQQAKDLKIDDMIIFTGRVEHDELPIYYGACQLYITASLSDTNSISMKEAMAIGLPVIHIKDDLNAGQIIDGENGYVFKDADDMYRILIDYKNKTPKEKQELSISVINSVKKFSCEALAEYLIEIYDQAIEDKNNNKK